MMDNEQKKALSKVRMEHAKECLSTSKNNYRDGDCKSSANRSYYAIFHAMRAVLAFDGIDMRHHSGIISEFRRLYIKTGVFSAELSKIVDRAFRIRTEADYDDFYIVDIGSVKKQIDDAEMFITEIEAYLATK